MHLAPTVEGKEEVPVTVPHLCQNPGVEDEACALSGSRRFQSPTQHLSRELSVGYVEQNEDDEYLLG